jgi:hypothetical protein
VAAFLVIGLSGLISWGSASHYGRNGQGGPVDPLQILRGTWVFGLLALIVLGVLVVSNEYANGLIGATLVSTPKRARLLIAKICVFTVVTFVVAEVISFASFFLSHAIISAYPAVPNNLWITDHNVLRAVIGAGIYATLVGLVGLGAGSLLRHTAGGISACVGFILILPGLLSLLPSSWSNPIEEYWPTEAGHRVMAVIQAPNTLTAWWGTGDLVLFVVVLLVAAGYVLVKRDA